MLKLNGRLQPLDSVPARQKYTPGVEFEAQYEVQARQINASQVAFQNIVERTVGTDATGDFSLGSALFVASEITFTPPYQNKPVFGLPFVSIYQGTVTTAINQIYPGQGANVTPGRYLVQGGYDPHDFDGISPRWEGVIVDTSGTSTQAITLHAEWQYLYYNATRAS